MPPDQPGKQSGPSNRRHRSLSISIPPSVDDIDITDTSEPATSSSRKHDRQEGDHPVKGPSKRQKTNRGSEPPMRKDTTMTPKTKRQRSRRKVNHHKASRTSEHQKLKDRVETLELELNSARQAHDDTTQELQENLDWHIQELKRRLQREDELAEEVRAQDQMVATERHENQRLKRELKDLANHVEASALSCKNKDEELERKEGAIAAKQKELDDSKNQSAQLERSLGETTVTLKGKNDVIANLQKKLHDHECHVESLKRSLAEKEVALEGKDTLIASKQKELDDSKNYSASLEKSLAQKEVTIKGKDALIATKQKELDDSKHNSASLKEELDEKKQDFNIAERKQKDWRNKLAKSEEKLTSTERNLNKAEEERDNARLDAEGLHRVNDANGHRMENMRSREKRVKNEEKKAKDALKSAQTEHEHKASKFEAKIAKLQASLEDQESQKNEMVASLQLRLKECLQQSQRYTNKQPDEKTKAYFTSLESKIRQFVNRYARPVLKAPEQELKTVWPNWSPELPNFLATPLLCNQVFEAYVWECLVARVFALESAIWTSELGRSLEKTLSMAADETAHSGFKSDLYIDFQYLRSSSSSLIGRLDGANFHPECFESDVKTMVAKLAKLTGLDEIQDTMKDDAMEIFELARDFEIQLRMLKATHTIRMYKAVAGMETIKYGFDFADEDMDDRSPTLNGKSLEETRSVDFIMSPGLYKRGNNSGASYETETCLIKMGVMCNTTELVQKSGSSTPLSNSSSKAKKGSSMSDPLQIEEATDSRQDTDQLSTSGPTSGPRPAPLKPSGTAQMQSGTATNVRTRSQGPQKAGSDVHAGMSSTKPTNNHLHPTGTARGRGGASSAKKTRTSKRSDSDPDWKP